MSRKDPKHAANRLIHETSPYLLQHAHNPVDWHPWGPEAFEAARKQNKPIFLSVGYSTCYWCHVMERECFENEQIAREMNARFINIKVDREERPDVDQLYMLAVQLLTRQGGWPMSVFLAPDLRPFYGGTYFPPTDAMGRPGFLTVLRGIDQACQERLADVEKTCSELMRVLQELAEPQGPEAPLTIDEALIEELVDRSVADYDPAHGGFGQAPKFPRETLLEMLLAWLDGRPQDERSTRVRHMLRHVLTAMASGGIRDHLGGGFHRYSTDAAWVVPHFEIMLYDNAMLAWVYAEASRRFGEPRYAQVARGILDFVLRTMTSPQGAFYTAIDAEVDAREGDPYVWTAAEVEQALGAEDAKLFARIYGLDRGPNFADPHHGTGQADRNVLYIPEPLEQLVAGTSQTPEQIEAKLAPMRQKLLAVREARKQPLMDTKIITSWNALMIRALAHAGSVLGEPRYVQAAAAAADWLLEHHVSRADGTLYRVSREAKAKQPGFLDDYAHFSQALLALHAAGAGEERRRQAARIAQAMLDRFGDADGGGLYFSAAGLRDVPVRQKVAGDSPLPSGNAVAAMVLIELDHDDQARDLLGAFARHLDEAAESSSALVQAAIVYLRHNEPIPVSPGPWRGEDRPLGPEQLAAGVVSLEAAWTAPDELQVHVAILDTFHINAHEPGAGLAATMLSVVGEAAGEVESVEYPPGEPRQFAFTTTPIRVYEKLVTIAVKFKRSMGGSDSLKLSLAYQACNDNACLPVVTRQFEINAA